MQNISRAASSPQSHYLVDIGAAYDSSRKLGEIADFTNK
jgi:hypothetical protein